MASNHIMLATNLTIGADAMGAVNAVRSAREQVAKMYGIMSEFADDMTGLGAYLGVSANEAATVKANFLNAKTVLEGADISYLVNRLGQ